MKKKVYFVSQRKQRTSEYGCGVAATMMLLKYQNILRNLSYEELEQCLWIDVNPEIKEAQNGFGVYYEDVIYFFKRMKIPFKATSSNKKELNAVIRRLESSPIMVEMLPGDKRWGEFGHWIVIYAVTGNNIKYLDPQYIASNLKHDSSIKIADFQAWWTGTSIQILS